MSLPVCRSPASGQAGRRLRRCGLGGLHDSFRGPAVRDTYLDDAIGICVENGSSYITGSNERSVLIAAYRFLKKLAVNLTANECFCFASDAME